MRLLKLFILCVIVTVALAISWVIGNMVGNAVTQSSPPPPADAAKTGLAFLCVCAVNSVLVVLMLAATDKYGGVRKHVALCAFIFAIQFLLPQMETFFFASDIGITYAQTTAILVAGAVASLGSVATAITVYDRLVGHLQDPKSFTIPGQRRSGWPWLVSLIIIAYPLLYLTFGYFVAWQNEDLRVFYTSSSELASFQHQVGDALTNGIYLFQVLRALIWVIATVPIVILLQGNSLRQYLMVAMLSALLPTSLLFIPNPYMPYDVAMTHFVETSTSNFVWGLLMTFVIKKMLQV